MSNAFQSARATCLTIVMSVCLCTRADGLARPMPRSVRDRQQLDVIWEASGGSPTALSRLRAEFGKMPASRQRHAVDVLQSRCPAEARMLLRDISEGKLSHAPGVDTKAALALCTGRNGLLDARVLLRQGTTKVRELVVTFLRKEKVPVDSEMLRSLEPLLQDKSLLVRWQAVTYIAEVPGSAAGRDKASALIRSASTVEKADDASEPATFYDSIGERWTRADLAYMDLTTALRVAEGIDNTLLSELIPPEPGPARDCVVVALGNRGDRSVKDELWRIIRGHTSLILRKRALGALATVGDSSDLPELRRLAESDPLVIELTPMEQQRMRVRNPGSPVPDRVWPIRRDARSVVLRIREAQGRSAQPDERE